MVHEIVDSFEFESDNMVYNKRTQGILRLNTVPTIRM